MAVWIGYTGVVALLLYISAPVNGEVCVETALPNLQHGVHGSFCIINETAIIIRDFYYDSQGPDAHLYYYLSPYTSSNVSRFGGGHFIRHPDSTRDNGRFPTSEAVENKTLTFSLPNNVYACDMAVFTIWCQWARSFFTKLDIPPSVFTMDSNEAADGSKILCTRGIAPTTSTTTSTTTEESPTNETTDSATDATTNVPTDPTPRPAVVGCQQLAPSINLNWRIDWNSASVKFTLCGCLNPFSVGNTWLGFGLSGSNEETKMEGADVAITWIDRKTGTAFAEDYYLSAYTQCQRGSGACPDTMDSSGNCHNDVTLISGSLDGFNQCVVFTRDFNKSDQCDQELDPDKEDQFIVWGAGSQGQTAFRHSINSNKSERPLHLANPASSSCPDLVCSSCPPYSNRQILAPTDTTFVAHIGPSGNERGYAGITGLPSWGIAWYINGTLIPELVVQRGKTYTFIVYGGDDPKLDPSYHPFYITSSKDGGFLIPNGPEETVYAGLDNSTLLGVGPLCDYTTTDATRRVLSNCSTTLTDYKATLRAPSSGCGASATSNSFIWTPNNDTLDIVYYQCASHYGLGWRIRVVDEIDTGKDDDVVGSGSGLGLYSSLPLICLLAILIPAMNYNL